MRSNWLQLSSFSRTLCGHLNLLLTSLTGLVTEVCVLGAVRLLSESEPFSLGSCGSRLALGLGHSRRCEGFISEGRRFS